MEYGGAVELVFLARALAQITRQRFRGAGDGGRSPRCAGARGAGAQGRGRCRHLGRSDLGRELVGLQDDFHQLLCLRPPVLI
jgi:hypothetical protein